MVCPLTQTRTQLNQTNTFSLWLEELHSMKVTAIALSDAPYALLKAMALRYRTSTVIRASHHSCDFLIAANVCLLL